MSMWNPWRGCKKCSEGCKYCYIHKGDQKRNVNTNEIIKTKDFEKIYSACDYFGIGGKTKEVYEKIAEELNVKTSEVLHIGDNYVMDVENAEKAGVNSILYNDDIENLIYNIKKFI